MLLCYWFLSIFDPNLVFWTSKKQQIASRSSAEVEYQSLVHICANYLDTSSTSGAAVFDINGNYFTL